jgi:hypothetical protein
MTTLRLMDPNAIEMENVSLIVVTAEFAQGQTKSVLNGEPSSWKRL